jgi:hypothetical protein
MKKKVVSIVPFFDVVEFYLRKEDVSKLPKNWQKFNASAQECMAILKEILGLTKVLPAKGKKKRMLMMVSALSSKVPQCTNIPTWSSDANEYLTNSVPADLST